MKGCKSTPMPDEPKRARVRKKEDNGGRGKRRPKFLKKGPLLTREVGQGNLLAGLHLKGERREGGGEKDSRGTKGVDKGCGRLQTCYGGENQKTTRPNTYCKTDTRAQVDQQIKVRKILGPAPGVSALISRDESGRC